MARTTDELVETELLRRALVLAVKVFEEVITEKLLGSLTARR